MMKLPWRNSLPILFALCLALGFVLMTPGKIEKDAGEYEAIAQSITHGQFALDGRATMLREPGYPLFRAFFDLLHVSPFVILVVQAVLFAATVGIVGAIGRRIEPRVGSLGAWAAACSYGLAVYSSRHLLEILTAFLCAMVAWVFCRALEDPKVWVWRIGTAVASGLLLLTRMSFLFLPFALIGALFVRDFQQKIGTKKMIRNAIVTFVVFFAMLMPWVIRNGLTFGAWTITQRTGITLYARALKAEMPWERLGASYVSVLLGQSLLMNVAPTANPVLIQHWKDVWQEFEAKQSQGRSDLEVDSALKQEAVAMIMSRPEVTARFVLWSGVDLLRFMAFPSPGTPEFSIEGMFIPVAVAHQLTAKHLTILVAADLIQFVWFALIAASIILGFRRYGLRFVPGLIMIPVVVAHGPTDDIIRYGAPLHPWFLLSIAILLIPYFRERLKRKTSG